MGDGVTNLAVGVGSTVERLDGQLKSVGKGVGSSTSK